MSKPGSNNKPPPSTTRAPPVPVENVPDFIKHPAFFPVLTALIVLALTILCYIVKRKSKGRVVLLVGPTDVGKSAMFSHVVGGVEMQTVTSVIPNEGEFYLNNGKQPLIIKDLPGHERVRIKFWDTSKAGVRGIVCVVDSSGGNKAVRESAEIIYTVLTDSTVLSLRPRILIFANKQDAPLAKTVNVIKTQLERELTTLRMTKSASLTSTGGGNTSEKYIGKADRDFEFAHVNGIKIDFAEGFCSGDAKVSAVIDWLNSVAY